jgi:hypothetical protein
MNILKIFKVKYVYFIQLTILFINLNLVACQWSTKKSSNNEHGSLDMGLDTDNLIGAQKDTKLIIQLTNPNKNVLLQNFKLKATLEEEAGGKGSQISYTDSKSVSHTVTSLYESLACFSISNELTVDERMLKLEFTLLPTETIKKLSARFELFDNQDKLIKTCTVTWNAEAVKVDLELIQNNPQPLKGDHLAQLIIKNKGNLKINSTELKLKVVRKAGNMAVIDGASIQNNEAYIDIGAIKCKSQIEQDLKINSGTDKKASFNLQLWYQGRPIGNNIEIVWERGIILTTKDVTYNKDTGEILYTISNQGSEIAKMVKLSYYTNTLQQKIAGKHVATPIWQELLVGDLVDGQEIIGRVFSKLDFINNEHPRVIVRLSYEVAGKINYLKQEEIYFELSNIINGEIKGKMVDPLRDKNTDSSNYASSNENVQGFTQQENASTDSGPAPMPPSSGSSSSQIPTSDSPIQDNTKQDTFTPTGESSSTANVQTSLQQKNILKDGGPAPVPPSSDSSSSQIPTSDLSAEDNTKQDTFTPTGKKTSAANVQPSIQQKNILKDDGPALAAPLSDSNLSQITTPDLPEEDKIKQATFALNSGYVSVPSSDSSPLQPSASNLPTENDTKNPSFIPSEHFVSSIDKEAVSYEKEKVNPSTGITKNHHTTFKLDYVPPNTPTDAITDLTLKEDKKVIRIELNFSGKIHKEDHSFEDREIGVIEIINKGVIPVNTKNIHFILANTKGVYFKCGSRSANSDINTTLNKFAANSELQPGQSLAIPLQVHSNIVQIDSFMVNLTLKLLDEHKHVLADESLVWINKQHKLYKSIKKFDKAIKHHKKEFDEIVENTEENFKTACKQPFNTKNGKSLDKWRDGLKSTIIKSQTFRQLNKQYEGLINRALQELDLQIGKSNVQGKLFATRNFVDSVKVSAENLTAEFEQFYLFNLENSKNWIVYIHKLIEHRIHAVLVKLHADVSIEIIRNAANSITAGQAESKLFVEQSPLILCTGMSRWLDELINLSSKFDMLSISITAAAHDHQFMRTVKEFVEEAKGIKSATKLRIEEAKDFISRAFFTYILKVETEIKAETSHVKLAKLYQLVAQAYQYLAEFDYAFLATKELIEDAKAAHKAAIYAANAARMASEDKLDHEANQATEVAYGAAIAIYKCIESIFDIYEMQKAEPFADYYEINLKYIKDTICNLQQIRESYLSS